MAVHGGEVHAAAFQTVAGVRQGCVIAPMLFNVFMDFVLKEGLARMEREKGGPCGVQFEVDGREGVALAAMLYADDLALLSCGLAELRCMLHTMDDVSSEMGLRINAGKTVVVIFGKGAQADCMREGLKRDPIILRGGAVKVECEFRYLGGWLHESGKVDREVTTRVQKAVGVFKSLNGVWSNKKLGLCQKAAVYSTFVVPHFLYGAETWNCTKAHVLHAERAHRKCLRHMLGVSLQQHHSSRYLYATCNVPAMELLLARHRLRWAGHVYRMGDDRSPRLVMPYQKCLVDDKGKSKYVLVEPVVVGGKRPKGRPQQEFRHTLVDTIEDSCIIGSIDSLASLQLHAQQRGAFRRLLQEMVLKPPPPPAKPTRVQPSREAKTLANERMQEQLSG